VIQEKFGDKYGAAITCHELGRINQLQGDFLGAEGWYRKALDIDESLGDEHGAASTCGQLGILARLQGCFDESARWLLRATLSFARTNDPEGVRRGTQNFLISIANIDEPARSELRAIWRKVGLAELPSKVQTAESKQGTREGTA
jgi:Tetratricopeptide repeat